MYFRESFRYYISSYLIKVSRSMCQSFNAVTLHTVQTSLPAITPFFAPLKKGSEGQTIHLGRRRQAVRVELVHNATRGILRDSHSHPCVAVGQVPQQPGLILLTYRYWFLFLGFRLDSFLMPLINTQVDSFKYLGFNISSYMN